MKKNKDSSNESQGSGTLMDDVNTTATVGGTKSVVFGLAMDTIGRSNPTHMLPLHVRQVLSRFMQANSPLPLYSDDLTLDPVTGALTVGTPSVASELSVNVADAEDFGLGIEAQDNTFLNYTDTPLNGEVLDRLAFWRYSPSAHELDPRMLFEPQVVAVDGLTQLFAESFDFHFNFLLTLDSEYHRLRGEGPQGTLDDSSENSAWYNMYHCWRDIVEQTYLDTGQVVLPVGKRNGNWTIADVLDEILILMTTLDGTLLPDIYLTAKGVSKAKSGATLGISGDPSMTDGDGNPRFIMPAWEAAVPYNMSATASTFQSTSVSSWDEGQVGSNIPVVYNTSGIVTSPELVALSGVATMSPVEGTSLLSLNSFLGQANRTPPSYACPASYRQGEAEPGRSQTWWAATSQIMPMTLAIHDLPDANGVITHDGTDYVHWRGYQLNIVQLIAQLRRMGRMLEPEVAEGFLPSFGLLGSVSPLFELPSGMTPRTYDDLYNLYASDFTYRENPIRTYTAAHMGPIDQEIPDGTLMIEGVNINTQTGADVLSVRERYWTPESMTADQIANVLSYFIPGQSYDETMLGSLTFGIRAPATPLGLAVDETAVGLPPHLVSRLLGNSGSMLTKVEKPAVLPAGVTSAETTYASGIGMGSIQLVGELVRSALYGAPKFTLGHNGFVDWTARGMEEGQYVYSPLPRAAASAASGDVILFVKSITPETAKPDLAATMLAEAISSVVPDISVAASEAADSIYNNLTGHSNDVSVQAIAAAFPACLLSATHAMGEYYGANWTNQSSAATQHPISGQMRVLSPQAFVETKQVSFHSIDTTGSWGIPTRNLVQTGFNAGPPPVDSSSSFALIPQTVRITIPGGTPLLLNTGYVTGMGQGTEALKSGALLRSVSEYEMKTAAKMGTNYVMTERNGKIVKAQIYSSMVGLKNFVYYPQVHLGDLILEAISTGVGLGTIDLSDLDTNLLEIVVECVQVSAEDWQSNAPAYGVSADVTANEFTNDWATTPLLNEEGTVEYHATVSWDSRKRTNLPVDISISADRTQSLNSSRTVTGEVVSAGRAIVTLTEVVNNAVGSYFRPMNAILNDGSVMTHNHCLVGYGERSSLAPMGEWDNFVWSMEDTLNIDVANEILGSGSRKVMETSEYDAGVKVDASAPDEDWLAVMLRTPGAINLGATTTTSLSGQLVAGYRSATRMWGFANSNEGVRVANPFVMADGPLTNDNLVAYSAGDGHSVTYIIPDEPANRMVYKPFKRLVDAAVSKELKQFFVPTHERYDAIGGPFGLPFYGQPAHFRFAALVLDAELPGQFVLEKAETKTRMVDSSNRGMLSFGKVTLLDEQTDRHLLTDTVKTLNAAGYSRWITHSSGIAGDVFSRDYIRFVQQGRQMQRF